MELFLRVFFQRVNSSRSYVRASNASWVDCVCGIRRGSRVTILHVPPVFSARFLEETVLSSLRHRWALSNVT